ncbi:hypothetical protein RQP46_004258 [Phenoliferia psychrophenolica]
MGICSERFITPVPEFLVCPVCFDVLDDPHAVCKEEHTYCKTCVGNANDGCPTCRAPRDPRPAIHLGRIIGEFELTCVNKEQGCPWTGPVSNEKEHGLGCIYRDVACPNSVFGCDVKVQSRNLATHVSNECKHETAECPRGGVDCGGPGRGRYQRSAAKAHDDVCLKWKCRVTRECATTGKHTNPAAGTYTAGFKP